MSMVNTTPVNFQHVIWNEAMHENDVTWFVP